MGRVTGATAGELDYLAAVNRRCFDIVLSSAASREAEPLLKAYMDSLAQTG